MNLIIRSPSRWPRWRSNWCNIKLFSASNMVSRFNSRKIWTTWYPSLYAEGTIITFICNQFQNRVSCTFRIVFPFNVTQWPLLTKFVTDSITNKAIFFHSNVTSVCLPVFLLLQSSSRTFLFRTSFVTCFLQLLCTKIGVVSSFLLASLRRLCSSCFS